MSGQKDKKPFLKNFDWRRRFGSQKSGSTEQQTLTPGPSNQPETRSRSPLRWLSKSLAPSTAASPTVTPPGPVEGDPSAGAATPTGPAAVPTPPAPSGGDPSAGATAPPAVSAVASTPTVPSGGSTGIGATILTNSSSLWQRSLEIARIKLAEKGLPPLNLVEHALPASEIVQLTITDLQTTIGGQQNDKSAAVQRLQEILKTFDKYARVVDTAIQHSPEVTALVWAGVRGILQVALNHMEITENLEQVTATIIEKVALCDFYASIYMELSSKVILLSAARTQHLQQILESALPELYATVLVFSVKARQYFDPSVATMTKLAYMLRPFATEFQPFIDDISEKEERVRECADMATMKRMMECSGTLGQIQILLNDIGSKVAPLTKLSEIIDITAKAELRRVQELLHMLSPLESPKRHQDVRSSRVDGTGAWLLQHERFCQWRDSTTQGSYNHILCCYGAPGAGKTMISSIVIDHLIAHFPRRDTIGIAYLYCDYRDQASQTVLNILGSLLQQFLIAVSQVPDTVISILESIQQQRKRVEIADVFKMLKTTLPKFDPSFVCIDALDELDPKVQKGLLEVLRTEFSTTRIFLTGRPHIQLSVNTYLGLNVQQHPIDVTADPSDIRAYISDAIAQDTSPDAMNERLKDDILSAIVEKSQGMFLLPVLHISMILGHRTISRRRKALQELPTGLPEALARTIDRIKLQPSAELGMRILMWLHLAYRPLKLDELSHALAVERDHTTLDKENIPSKKALLECCLGLVILDEETMTVRFVHYSVEEYFKQHAGTYFPNRYSTAAETCLTYLNFNKLAHPCTSIEGLEQLMRDFPFLEYAACHWGHYVRQEQHNNSVRDLAFRLLQHRGEESYCALQVLHYRYLLGKYYPRVRDFTTQFMGIHAAACFGLELYMPSLVIGPNDWNLRDEDGNTPLLWATMEGHEAVVRLLVEREDVEADSKYIDGQTPLSLAAFRGHEAIVRLLVEREDVEADSKDDYGQTPLSLAAENGHEGIVRLLVEREDVEADSKSNSGRTPLSCAARNGHEAIVRLLVEREDVEADSKDNYGQTPLSLAAENGHEAIVRLLVERGDVGADSKDNGDRTPLSWAAKNGHEGIVRLLIKQEDIDTDSKDNVGETPLSWAALYGHEAIVKLLSDARI